MDKPIKLFTTEDGYRFWLMESGRVVDNIDSAKVSDTWEDEDDFIRSMAKHDIRYKTEDLI